jgi:hypothetical protein
MIVTDARYDAVGRRTTDEVRRFAPLERLRLYDDRRRRHGEDRSDEPDRIGPCISLTIGTGATEDVTMSDCPSG